MAQRGELLFDRLRLESPDLELHPGRNMDRLDVQQTADLHFLGPNEEIHDGAEIGLARVLVPDLRGEELDEAFLCIAPGRNDQARNIPSPVSAFQNPGCSRDQIPCHETPMNSS